MNSLQIFFIIICFFFKNEVLSIEPNEMLEDPKLESVAREISKNIRCLVCQNEDIQNSNADIAKDLRVLIRKQIKKGKTKKEIFSYIHDRYGDFVLYNPPVNRKTISLWLIPLFFFLFLFYVFFRKKKR
ncbi:MAG: hypothetical protein CMP32_04730 [Rickettsiales bacterium]|nr:hypothetical protein [Rickettsiales bacterium]|tara:strand:- start:185 stop:571 length:387 start_codon:yes stop_codon:yes gene_type:complete